MGSRGCTVWSAAGTLGAQITFWLVPTPGHLEGAEGLADSGFLSSLSVSHSDARDGLGRVFLFAERNRLCISILDSLDKVVFVLCLSKRTFLPFFLSSLLEGSSPGLDR